MVPAANPPKPSFALKVGVVGHRPNRLPLEARPTVERLIADALTVLRAAAAEVQPRHAAFLDGTVALTLVSALAEGADRMAAKAARAAGYALEAVLPFARAEYERDFAEPTDFRALLAGARSIVELDGERRNEGKAYEAAGLMLLDASDVLLAVWDGAASAGRGGTAELIEEAGRRDMPVIHIDASARVPTRILWNGLQENRVKSAHIADQPSGPFADNVVQLVDTIVRPPRGAAEREGLHRFLTESDRRWIGRQSLSVLMSVFGVRQPQWRDLWPMSVDELADAVSARNPLANPMLVAGFAWADRVAVYCSNMFRSSFVDNLLALALAVLVAATGLFAGPRWLLEIAEILLILWVLWNTSVALKQRWHRRWMESQEVAERLRLSIAMAILGTRPLGPYGEPLTWTSWYVRALLRACGLPFVKLDAERINVVKEAYAALLVEQRNYHRGTARRFAELNRRLRLACNVLLTVTILALLLQVTANLLGGRSPMAMTIGAGMDVLVVLSLALPALGAALYGIRIIGGFDGISRRATRMQNQLRGLSSMLSALPSDFHSLRAFSQLMAQVMLGELAIVRRKQGRP
jgi:hypothetical protein